MGWSGLGLEVRRPGWSESPDCLSYVLPIIMNLLQPAFFLACSLGVTSFLLTQSPATAAKAAPVKIEAATAFAKEIEKAINAGDHQAFDDALNVVMLADLSCKGLPFKNAAQQSEFLRSMTADLKRSFSLGQNITKAAGDSGEGYTLLRVRQIDGDTRALFRLLGESGLNYHDLVLAMAPSGKVEIIDAEIYMSGEMLSQTMRRLMLPAVANMNRGFLERLTKAESAYVKHVRDLKRMTELGNAGHHAEALAIYEELPEALQYDPSMLVLSMEWYGYIDMKKYETQLVEFRKRYPNAGNSDLVGIDFFFLQDRFDETLQCVDSLDKKLGGDPHLESMRASALVAQKKFKEAREALLRGLKVEPKNSTLMMGLADVALAEKNWPELARSLALVESNTAIRFELESVESFAEFLETEEYRKWMAARPKD